MMTIFDIFKAALELGIEKDFRPKTEILRYPRQQTLLGPKNEKLINPYPDSGLVRVKNLAALVSRLAVGIEIGTAEILTLQQWEKVQRKKIGLILAHHPDGPVLSRYPFILETQLGNLASQGVQVSSLIKYFKNQTEDVLSDIYGTNFIRIKKILEVFDYNCITLHTPVDNLGARYIEALIQKNQPKTLGECVQVLSLLPEYRLMKVEGGLSPMVINGKLQAKLGKFLLTEFTGGEEGPRQIYSAIKKAGFSTVIAMYMSKEGVREIKKLNLNLIFTGHSASDSIGLNLLCDIIEKTGVEIVPVDGFIRYRR